MTVHIPSEVLQLGKNKGYTVAEIYQYDPTYLKWLIKYKLEFITDVGTFQTLALKG